MNKDMTERLIGQYQTENITQKLFETFSLSKILNRNRIRKVSGIPVVHLFYNLFLLSFFNSSVHGIFNRRTPEALQESGSKDIYYRFLNNPKYNWRNMLYDLAIKCLNLIKATVPVKATYLIADDTPIYKWGKRVEYSGWFFDHVSKKQKWGMTDLFLCWSDGKNILPLDFCIKAGSRFLTKYLKNVNGRTCGGIRRKESQKKKTTQLLELLRRSYSRGIDVSYVLFDSWFAFPSIISEIYTIGYHVICRVKKMPKIKYYYNSHWVNAIQLYKKARKNKPEARYKSYFLYSLSVNIKGEDGLLIPVRLVFSEDRNNHQYEVWLSTDVDLSAEKILIHYENRWEIECFFRTMKQHMRLGKEHSNTFESMISFTTLSCVRHILMLWFKLNCENPLITTGDAFHYASRNAEELGVADKIINILKTTFQYMSSRLVTNTLLTDFFIKLIDIITSLMFQPFKWEGFQRCET